MHELERIDNFLDAIERHRNPFDFFMNQTFTGGKRFATVTNLDKQEYQNMLNDEIFQLMEENPRARNVIMKSISSGFEKSPTSRSVLSLLPGDIRREIYRNAQGRFLLKNFYLFTQFEHYFYWLHPNQ